MAREELPPFKILRQSDVFAEERAKLGLRANEQPSALCLSGGGIRSAAFCLGSVQALARRRLLHHFHYLSTVSGGGYVGSWLTRCIAEQNMTPSASIGNVTAVEERILSSEEANEPTELQRLRSFTNFLTPRPGVASNDTWAGVVLWLRNTLVNWTVFFPLMLAGAAVPIFYMAVICALASTARGWSISLARGIIAIALLCLAVSVYHACINLPSHKHPDADPRLLTNAATYGIGARDVLRQIVVWSLLWGFLVPWSFVPLLHLKASGAAHPAFWTAGEDRGETSFWSLAIFPSCSVLVCVLAYLMAWARVRAMRLDQAHSDAFLKNLPGWTVSCLLSAAALWAGARLAADGSAIVIAVAGPVWVIAAELLRSAAYVAVRRDGLRTDLDREWLARLSGNKLRIALAYGAAAAAALFLPTLLFDSGKVWMAIAAVSGFLGGPVAALLGKVSTTAFSYGVKKDRGPIWKRTDWIIAVAITVFIAALFMLLGRLAALIADLASWSFWTIAGCAFAIIMLGSGIAVGLDRVINLNRFSMHAVYRNRLVRAFLGPARAASRRRPDSYTQFDPTDNLRMWDTFTARTPKALFLVINVTLNVTAGKDTARAERKGEPFIITPMHCGSASLGLDEQNRPRGAYIPTAYFAGADHETGPGDKELGITLGTAMTISGAAVSPNMGYHSSFFVAFVMTLFNVRLGAWLPNPGWQFGDGQSRMDENTAKRSGPVFAIPSLLGELAGLSDDHSKYVYLSDGGHFDNLGLYEMLRRRCKQIVVIDVGQDQDYAYFDLSHTLQRARIDMGLCVTFHPAIKVGGEKLTRRGAYAQIVYPPNGAERQQCGELLYLKPWLPSDAPVELTAFKRIKPDFPHVTTANQFFTESDFESYRSLGEHLTATALNEAHPMGPLTLDGLFKSLRQAPPSTEDPANMERQRDLSISPDNGNRDEAPTSPLCGSPPMRSGMG